MPLGVVLLICSLSRIIIIFPKAHIQAYFLKTVIQRLFIHNVLLGHVVVHSCNSSSGGAEARISELQDRLS